MIFFVLKGLLVLPLDYIILPCEVCGMEDVNDLRRKYMENPPEGYTTKDIERMSDEDVLDMDYFLNE